MTVVWLGSFMSLFKRNDWHKSLTGQQMFHYVKLGRARSSVGTSATLTR